MSRNPYLSLRRRLAVLTGALIAVLTGALTLVLSPLAAADLPSGSTFYRDPGSQVARWTAANQGDSRQPLISQVIGARPQGIWFAAYQPATVTADVRAITGPAASAGHVPVLVVYQLPDRDCGGASSGGAPDHPAYGRWIDAFAAGLGDDPVVVILEPDSLALVSCLSGQQLSDRYASLSRAGSVIHAANPEARVYYDAGHSAWHSPSVQAGRLRSAGLVANGDGIATNVSNYRATPDEIAFAKSVLGQLGDPSLGAVIDTSRNGQGPAPDSEWCDPPGRGVGRAPTTATGDADIDAFLWIKPPGEADGCIGPAGQFSPAAAYELARNAADGGSTGGTTTGGTTTGGTTDGGTTDGGTTDGGGSGCTAAYRVVNEWSGGFTGEVVIACAGDSLTGWNVSWTFPGNQQISQGWNAACSQQGREVTCANLGWNGTVPNGGSVSFGFNATFSGSNIAPTEVTLS